MYVSLIRFPKNQIRTLNYIIGKFLYKINKTKGFTHSKCAVKTFYELLIS
jgi:hypothetical protein